MGQYWMIANREKWKGNFTVKLGEAIYENIGGELISQLRKEWKITTKRNAALRTLGDLELPDELIEMAFSNIKDPWTAFHLGFANTRLLLIGEKRIRQLMGTPHWRGDHIICVGDNCSKNDIPEGLDLEYDYEVFCNSVQDGDSDDIGNVGPYCWACTFREPSSEFWKGYRLSKDLEWSWRSPIVSIGYPFISAASLYPPNSQKPRRNSALKWAGDRFEVTGDDVLELRLTEEGSKWKDVSEEVIKLFVDVFEAED